jgi:hypothetical protein
MTRPKTMVDGGDPQETLRVKKLLGFVAIAASARLANRLNSGRMIGHSPKKSTDTKVSTIPSSNCFAFAPLF